VITPRIYNISELSREMKVTTRTIRFYEEQGLLQPERRGTQRYYSARDRVQLELILRGKRIGLSLAECKELIDLYDPAGSNHKQLSRLLDCIAERRRQLREQILDIEKIQWELDMAEQRCRVALSGFSGAAHQINNNRKSGS